MRILHVVPTYYPAIRYGGPIRSVHGMAKALSELGHEVHVYTTAVDGPQDLAVPTDRPVHMDGVAVHYFSVPALRRLYWSPAMAKKLTRTISDFDVVHLHSVYLWPIWAAARTAWSAGIPYVIAPRGMLVRELIENKSRWIKRAWIELIERRTLARAAAVHVTTELEREDIRSLGLPISNACCVPNGLDVPSNYRPELDQPFAHICRPYALFLSRIHKKKGLDRLVRAWQWIPELPLVVVGNDEEGYQAELEALAHSVGAGDRIFFVGSASDDQKWALYANAELFVLPSYSENFGNVVAEAMAVGCPVVLSAAVGLAPTVQEAGAGIVVPGQPQEIAEAVRRLHSDDTLRRQMGAAGRRVVATQLSWSGVARQMEQVYRGMVAGAGRELVNA